MNLRSLTSLVANLLAIVACGVAGGAAGFGAMRWLEVPGAAGAVVAALVGMVAAAGAWAGGVAALRVAGSLR
jgi:2-keto-3-deoxy-galactonokinase